MLDEGHGEDGAGRFGDDAVGDVCGDVGGHHGFLADAEDDEAGVGFGCVVDDGAGNLAAIGDGADRGGGCGPAFGGELLQGLGDDAGDGGVVGWGMGAYFDRPGQDVEAMERRAGRARQRGCIADCGNGVGIEVGGEEDGSGGAGPGKIMRGLVPRADGQDGAGGFAEDVLGDRAKDEALEAMESIGAEDGEVDVFGLDGFQDSGDRAAGLDCRLAWNSGVLRGFSERLDAGARLIVKGVLLEQLVSVGGHGVGVFEDVQ